MTTFRNKNIDALSNENLPYTELVNRGRRMRSEAFHQMLGRLGKVMGIR